MLTTLVFLLRFIVVLLFFGCPVKHSLIVLEV